MGRPSRVIVLSEDQRQLRFARAYLKKHGFENHDIYIEPLPAGRGSGEQWVRERYARAVRAYRWRSTRAETALVVIIDADNWSVERRVKQLQQALTQADMEGRSNAERISHLVPKRHIETWILCLLGTNVDENTEYRDQQDVDKQLSAAAEVFYDWTRVNAQIPERCIPSLRSALAETRRLED